MFPKNKTKLDAYRIGKKGFGQNRAQLEQDAEFMLKMAGEDSLVGLTPEKLSGSCECLTLWKKADEEQDKAVAKQTEALRDLTKAVEDVTLARRGVQLAADVLWPYTAAANKAIRRAFKLPATRPARGG